MLFGFYPVVGREGAGEVRRLIRMARADSLRGARRMLAGNAIRASIAHRVVNRRDAIAFLDWLAGEIRLGPLAERMHHATHLVSRHNAASPAEFAPPHMHLGAAYVGLGDLGDETSGGRLGNVVFAKFDFVRAWNKTDFSFHGFPFALARKNVK